MGCGKSVPSRHNIYERSHYRDYNGHVIPGTTTYTTKGHCRKGYYGTDRTGYHTTYNNGSNAYYTNYGSRDGYPTSYTS